MTDPIYAWHVVLMYDAGGYVTQTVVPVTALTRTAAVESAIRLMESRAPGCVIRARATRRSPEPPEPSCDGGDCHDWGDVSLRSRRGHTTTIAACSRCGYRRTRVDGLAVDYRRDGEAGA